MEGVRHDVHTTASCCLQAVPYQAEPAPPPKQLAAENRAKLAHGAFREAVVEWKVCFARACCKTSISEKPRSLYTFVCSAHQVTDYA